MHNPPLNSYLTDDSLTNDTVNSDANDTVDVDASADTAIDPAIENPINSYSQESEFDDSSQSLDPFDSVSQTLSAVTALISWP